MDEFKTPYPILSKLLSSSNDKKKKGCSQKADKNSLLLKWLFSNQKQNSRRLPSSAKLKKKLKIRMKRNPISKLHFDSLASDQQDMICAYNYILHKSTPSSQKRIAFDVLTYMLVCANYTEYKTEQERQSRLKAESERDAAIEELRLLREQEREEKERKAREEEERDASNVPGNSEQTAIQAEAENPVDEEARPDETENSNSSKNDDEMPGTSAQIFLNNKSIPSAPSNEIFRCKICFNPYDSKMRLKRHVEEAHQSGRQNKRVCPNYKVSKQQNKIACTWTGCHYKFTTQQEVVDHMNTHTGERPYKCSICNMGSIKSSLLKKHMREKHNIMPYKCQVCATSFKRQDELRTHEKLCAKK